MSAAGREPFAPIDRATYTISVTTSNTATTLTQGQPVGSPYQVLFYNAGAVPVFVRFGDVATTADVPIPPGGSSVMTTFAGTTLGAITGSSTATLYATVGSGY